MKVPGCDVFAHFFENENASSFPLVEISACDLLTIRRVWTDGDSGFDCFHLFFTDEQLCQPASRPVYTRDERNTDPAIILYLDHQY